MMQQNKPVGAPPTTCSRPAWPPCAPRPVHPRQLRRSVRSRLGGPTGSLTLPAGR